MDSLKKVGGWAVALLLWLWAVLPKALDWVGRTTLPDDWEQLMAERLPAWTAWLFSTPWWVPALLAATLTFWMIWISRPRAQAETKPNLPASDGAQKPTYASPFEGKNLATAASIPQRLINEIDHDATNMAGCVRMHIVPIKIKRILDAPDPYLDITLRFWNETIYELRFVSASGRFSYKGHALRSDPQALTDEMTLSRRHAAALTLRQYVTPHVAEQMQQWDNSEFLPESIKVTFEFQNRFNKIITFDFPIPKNTKENP